MGTLDLYLVTSGSGQTGSTQIWTNGNSTGSGGFSSGSTDGRLHEANNGNLYIYGQKGMLLRSTNGGGSFSSIFPSGLPATTAISAISQTDYKPTSGSTENNIVVFTSGSGANSLAFYQPLPEPGDAPIRWKPFTILPAGSLNVTDAIFDTSQTIDLLISNNPPDLQTFQAWAFRYTPTSPFGVFLTSDGGIRPYNPELLPSIIDLDMSA